MRCVIDEGALSLKSEDFINIFIGTADGERFNYLFDTMERMKEVQDTKGESK